MLIVLFDCITVELHPAECFQVLLFNANSFSFIWIAPSYVFKYCYLMLIVLFDCITVELHTAECFQVLLFNANSFIWFKYYCWIAPSWMFSSIAECFQVMLINANSFIWFKYYCKLNVLFELHPAIKYCYLMLIDLIVLLLNCTQLNVFKYCYCYLMYYCWINSFICYNAKVLFILLNCTQLNVFKYCYLMLIVLFDSSITNALNCTQLNVFKYCYLMLIVLFDSSITVELHPAECFQVLLFNANSFIWFKYYYWIAPSWMFSSIAI